MVATPQQPGCERCATGCEDEGSSSMLTFLRKSDDETAHAPPVIDSARLRRFATTDRRTPVASCFL